MAGLFPAGHIPCERRLGASVGRSDGYEEWGNGDKTHVEWSLEGEHRDTPHPTETEGRRQKTKEYLRYWCLMRPRYL